MGKSKTGLPDRWLKYSCIGCTISGTNIFACKVPLKEAMLKNKNLAAQHWFTPSTLIEAMPDIGLIIDLTATDRYYDPQEFAERGVRHVKIACQGHVVPARSLICRFFHIVDEFTADPQLEGKLIAVHCTHGLNRTGYFVCRYLIERLGFGPGDAVHAFNEARGHSMERENYLSSLGYVGIPPPVVETYMAGYKRGLSSPPEEEAAATAAQPQEGHRKKRSKRKKKKQKKIQNNADNDTVQQH